MIKQLKITPYLTLISISIILISCTKTNYIKNKYRITGCESYRIDSLNIYLKFDIVYYSDSTQNNLFPSSIEKGLDGSDDKILFLGFNNIESNEFRNLINKINLNERGYKGEKIEKEYIIQNLINQDNDDLTLIIQRKLKIDTIRIPIVRKCFPCPQSK